MKNKHIAPSREELEEEIAALAHVTAGKPLRLHRLPTLASPNPHLRPSLDRKASSLGYIPRNLRVATRADNFFKSASDEADQRLKAEAVKRMAVAM